MWIYTSRQTALLKFKKKKKEEREKKIPVGGKIHYGCFENKSTTLCIFDQQAALRKQTSTETHAGMRLHTRTSSSQHAGMLSETFTSARGPTRRGERLRSDLVRLPLTANPNPLKPTQPHDFGRTSPLPPVEGWHGAVGGLGALGLAYGAGVTWPPRWLLMGQGAPLSAVMSFMGTLP